MKNINILFIIFLVIFLIFIFYIVNKNNSLLNKFEYFCDKNKKECVLYSDGVNSCCDGLYCIRKKGNFHNRVCSDKPEEDLNNDFITNITKFGDKVFKSIVIEDCDKDSEGNVKRDEKRDVCKDGLFKIHVKCSKNNDKKNVKFPETTLFSLINDYKCTNKM